MTFTTYLTVSLDPSELNGVQEYIPLCGFYHRKGQKGVVALQYVKTMYQATAIPLGTP